MRRPDAARGQKAVELGRQHRLAAIQTGELFLKLLQATWACDLLARAIELEIDAFLAGPSDLTLPDGRAAWSGMAMNRRGKSKPALWK